MPKILVVEDEPLILRLAAHTLRAAGFQVFEAANGHEAQKSFLEHAPDLVVTDLYMPQLDGATLAQWIHARRPVPVVFMTAGTIQTDHDDLPGPKLHKPFALQELIDLVQITLSS